jgi:MYXO-CTERM domain-containing protein
MSGQRLLFLLAGLWAASAQSQVQSLTATRSIALDQGQAFARAFPVYVDAGAPYVLAGAGSGIQVFDTDGNEVANLPGQFQSFAVANSIAFGAETATLVAAGSLDLGCGGPVCLRVYRWDPDAGFQTLPPFVTSQAQQVPSMTIDTSSNPMAIVYSSFDTPPILYRLSFTINGAGTFVFNSPAASRISPSQLETQGLTVNAGLLYVSPVQDSLYTIPADVTVLDGGVFSSMSQGGFTNLGGLFYYPNPNFSSLAYVMSAAAIPNPDGGTTLTVAAFLNPVDGNNLIIGAIAVSAVDGGTVVPSAASITPLGDWMLVSENQNQAASDPPFVHLLQGFTFPDGGGGSVVPPTDAGGGGNPTIPVVPPGPGQNVGETNSCACASSGGAPLLLIVLILPFLLPRRRRT